MRFKNRYLLLEIKFSTEEDRRAAYTNLTEKGLVTIIKDAIQTLHGDFGVACVLHNIRVKYLNVATDTAILRCPRDDYRKVWSSITAITYIQGNPCSIRVIHVGGTIKCSQRYLIRHNQLKLKKMYSDTSDAVEKRKLREKIIRILKSDKIAIKT